MDSTYINGPNVFFRFNQSAIESMALNKFKIPPDIKIVNAHNSDFNSDGFRSDNFSPDADILFAGCSLTFGIGLPIDLTWTRMVSDHFDKPHYNLSIPGGSVTSIVSNIFEYFRIFENPKVLLCLFPDFYRPFVTKNYSLMKFNDSSSLSKEFELDEKNYYTHITQMHSQMDIPNKQIIKLPADPIDIIQTDLSYYMALSHINMLEQYCASNNIIFYWSVWQESNYRTLQLIRSRNEGRLEGLLDIEINKWTADYKLGKEIFNNSECHKDLEIKNPHVFHFADDRDHGIEKAHWGSHINKHISDIFIKNISYAL